jgi:hypothetical protein
MTAEVLFSFMIFSSIPRLEKAHLLSWSGRGPPTCGESIHLSERRDSLLVLETLLVPEAPWSAPVRGEVTFDYLFSTTRR